jgi:hypothetical protein
VLSVSKRRLLRLCSQRDESITEGHIKIIQKIQEFMKNGAAVLNQKEKEEIMSYLGKLEFLEAILRRGELKMNGSVGPAQEHNNIRAFEKLFRVLESGDEATVPIDFILG